MDDENRSEETVMLPRRLRRARAADAADERPATGDDVDERTVVIDRGTAEERTVVMQRTPIDERTVMIDRGADEERTVVMRRAPVDERTVVVDRSRRADTTEESVDDGAVAPASDLDPSTAETITAPPRRSVSEPGPAIYKPRPAPLVPSRPPRVTAGEPASRDTDAVTASVLRAGRRASVLAVVAIGAACVISVAGLTGLGILLLG